MAGGVLAWHHPLWPVPLSVLLVIWCGLVARFPSIWLFVVPACLPFLNFSPWSGWIVFEEFDLLLLGVAVGGYASRAWSQSSRGASIRPVTPVLSRGPLVLIVAVLLLSLIALWRGVDDAGGLTWDWFASYANALNSLRVFKSIGFALLLAPLAHQELGRSQSKADTQFAWGVVAGITTVVVSVLWERAGFVGLWDFSARYRTVGLFWEMHVGGAAIDAFLSMSAPFLIWALMTVKRPAGWLALAVLTLCTAYACLTTFSRGVYLAVVGSWAVLAVLCWARSRWAGVNHPKARWPQWRVGSSTVLALLLGAEVVVVLSAGTFMADRLSRTERDLGSRLEHWQNGLNLLRTPTDWVWGIGLGRLPAQYAAQTPGRNFSGAVWADATEAVALGKSGLARFSSPENLDSPDAAYGLTQRIAPTSGLPLATLEVRIESTVQFYIGLCERHLLYERNCQEAVVAMTPTAEPWQRVSVPLEGPSLMVQDGEVPRLTMLNLVLLTPSAQMDVASIELRDGGGPNLVKNGNFAAGMAHWFPAAQSYFLPWHIDNLYLEVLIERGLLGLIAMGALVVLALWRLTLGRGRLEALAPFCVASMVGVLLVGLVSSVLDVPRIAFLFFLIVLVAIYGGVQTQSTRFQ